MKTSCLVALTPMLMILSLHLNYTTASAEGEKRNYYEVLEVPSTATPDEIKKAYRRLALRYHPDHNPDRVEEASRMFREASEAYKVLIDSKSRVSYNGGRVRESWHEDVVADNVHRFTAEDHIPSLSELDAQFRRQFQAFNDRMGLGPMIEGYLEELEQSFERYRHAMTYSEAMITTLREFRKRYPRNEHASGWSAVAPARWNAAVKQFIQASLDGLFFLGPEPISSTEPVRFSPNRFARCTLGEILQINRLYGSGGHPGLMERAIQEAVSTDELFTLLDIYFGFDPGQFEDVYYRHGSRGDPETWTHQVYLELKGLLDPALKRLYPEATPLSSLFRDFLDAKVRWYHYSVPRWILRAMAASDDPHDRAFVLSMQAQGRTYGIRRAASAALERAHRDTVLRSNRPLLSGRPTCGVRLTAEVENRPALE